MTAMESYYTLLGLQPGATPQEIEAAYLHQRERYSPERVAELGSEFAQVAQQRVAELDTAYAALTTPASVPAPAERTGLSKREIGMMLGGAVLGLLLIVVVWTMAGRSTVQSVNMARLDRAAPDFTLTDSNGQPLNLADYRGQVVLVNFWYTKCAPCLEETPALQQAYHELSSEGLTIIGVNVRQNEQSGEAGYADVRSFIDQFGVTYPIVYDEKGDITRLYQVLPLPSSFFIDGTGTIRYASYSSLNVEEVERVFNELKNPTTASR